MKNNIKINSKNFSFFYTPQVIITTDKGEFHGEFQCIYYKDGDKWKVDLCELIDIFSIKLGDDIINDTKDINDYLKLLDKITNKPYWEYLHQIVFDEMEKPSTDYLEKLNTII